MCFGGEPNSEMKIKTGTGAEGKNMANPPGAPPLPPDLTDKALAEARKSMAMRLRMGSSRRQSFEMGPLGKLNLDEAKLGAGWIRPPGQGPTLR